MAVRKQNSPHIVSWPPSYYANNRLYPGSYARTEWQTRTSRRIHDGLSLPMNYGLDTTSDDVNSSPFSSPYYINGRYNSDNLVTQRGNSASVQGVERLIDAMPERIDNEENDEVLSTIEMWQGKQIKFELPYNGKVIGNTLKLRNIGGCTGILSIYISASENGRPIYETAIDLCDVSMDYFEYRKLYAMTPIPQNANPRGKVYVRMEIWDEVDQKRSANPFNTGRKIELAATGLGNHEACVYELSDKNIPVEEEYDYSPQPSRPMMALIYSDYESIPVNRHEDQDNGAMISLNGYRYDVFCVRDARTAKLVIYDYRMNKMIENTNLHVDARAKEVNIVQAADKVYYVDGYSSLQEFTIGEWQSTAFPASTADSVKVTVNLSTFAGSDLGGESGDYIFTYESGDWKYKDNTVSLGTYGITYRGTPSDSGIITVSYVAAGQTVEASIDVKYTDARPVIAASIICKHNNRIYLGGFRNDPNLIQCSRIVAEGPDYDSYPYRFYVPDNSPYATSTNTVSAIVEYQSDALMILSKSSFSIFTSNVNLEDGTPTQTSTYIDGGGVQSAGDVTNYQGVVYSFDPDEGIRRYSGAIWNPIPNNIKSLTDRVDMSKPRKMWGYAQKLYFNYTDKVDGKPKCLVWDKEMNYQQYPWFQDSDIPFCDVRHDDDFDIIGIHPDYPCIMRLYAPDCWRRLDTPITFERHTKYVSLPGNAANMIVERVHNKVIANSNRWWWFSLSTDEDLLIQKRGGGPWYRLPCWDTLSEEQPPEVPFPYQDTYEEKAISLLTISNIRLRAISVQEKVKCKTFRAQANLVSILFESRVRQYN